MAHSYPEPRKTRYGVVLIGVGIALCAFVLGWLARLWVAPSEPDDAETGRVTAPSASPNGQPTVAGPVDERLARCQQVYAAQEPALAAGAASMSQWSTHIGAMNKLVAGDIGLGQATAYWNQTRVGAKARLNEYADAANRYDERTVRCPRAAAQGADSPLSSCARAVVARHRQLATLREALGTWRTHVRHMEMLRRGEMTPDEAVARWLKTWRQGQSEVRAYGAAVQDAQAWRC